MAYLDIIPLASAKLYLRIDDTMNEDDAQITRMIESALRNVEDITNIMLYDRARDYTLFDGYGRIYDFPINLLVTPYAANITAELKTLYTYLYNDTLDTETITLNVGYDTVGDIPTELIDVAYEMIEIYYYGKETRKSL